LANEYLAKGRQVYVEGRLRLEEYTDRGGQKRFSAEVSATEIQFLGNRTDAASANAAEVVASANQTPAPPPRQQGNSNNPKKTSKGRRGSQEELVSIEDDEIPF
jgi:single-strand DNA-binding protein